MSSVSPEDNALGAPGIAQEGETKRAQTPTLSPENHPGTAEKDLDAQSIEDKQQSIASAAMEKPKEPTCSNEDNTVAEPIYEDESKYPSGFALAILTIGLCLSIFVIALDNTIIATAIPTITTTFNSLDDVGWYGSAYLLTTTSLQPSFGKIYTYFNVKWTYLSALIIFEAGSIICAAARNSPMLIVGRAVAGAGAAALYSGGMTIIGFSVPLRKRPIFVACLSSMFGIASVVGPILGGALTDKASWRWCFWINLPFGGVALLTVFIFFKNPERDVGSLPFKEKLREIDILGAGFLISGIVCLLLALQWGGTTFAWNNSKVYGLFIGFVLLIAVFVVLQVKLGEQATIPVRIFLKQRTVLSGSVYSMLLSMGLYTHIYYLPFYFQAVKGTTAEGSGIRSIPYLVSVTCSSLVVGGAITVLGYYAPFMWIGAAIFAVGAALLSILRVGTNAGGWIGYQILAGAGAGAGIQIPFIAVQVVLNARDMPTGNAVVIFFNSLGGAISISVAQNVFANTLLKEVPKYTTGINPATIIATGATHLREVVSASQLPGVLQAYTVAINKAFILPIAVGSIGVFISFFIEWKSVKGKRLMGGGGA